MASYQPAEDSARAQLRALVEQNAQSVFGSPTKEIEDMAETDSVFYVLERGRSLVADLD
jgi:hypothetical protein